MQPSPDQRAGRARDARTARGQRVPSVLLAAAPLVLIALCGLDLIGRARSGIAVVASNLPPQPASSAARVVDLVQPTAPEGRVFRVVAEETDRAPGAGTADARTALDDDAPRRVQLQLESRGRTRILLVQPEQADASRLGALLGVVRGRTSLQVVDDREWVDLGALPDDGTPLRVQVIGLLPRPFAFAELARPPDPSPADAARIAIALLPSDVTVSTSAPRFRIVRDAPVPAIEVVRRATFFVRASPLLLTATLLAIAGLCAGWALLATRGAWTAVALLVASTTVLHATLLPPLQAADETSQVGTIEWLLADPSPARAWQFPDAIARVARVLDQDRVQYSADEPLPIGDAAARARLADVLRSQLGDAGDAGRAGTPPRPPAAELQVVELRAPLFFAPYPLLAGALLPLPVVDRLAAYRLFATVWCLLAFVAGLVLLRAGGLPVEIGLAYGLAFLWPYAVGVAASCSNYAPAIGVGFLFAAATVTAILGATSARRRLAAAVALAAAWTGVPLWPDFLALALVTSAVALLASVGVLVRLLTARRSARGPSPRAAAIGAALPIALAAGVAWTLFPTFNYQLRLTVAGWDRAALALRAALLAAPLALAAVAAAFCWPLHRLDETSRRRRTRVASAVIALLLVVAFAVTPYAEVPYERVFLPLGDLVRAHLASFLASSFAFDQDRLGWKFLLGTFGWHDAYYPEAVYAVARWALTLLVVALPVLVRDVAATRPLATVALLLAAGAGASLAVATLLARHAMTVHPHGRFALPYLALIALPVLALLATQDRRRALRAALLCGVALNVWTAIVVLGARYTIAR